MKRKNISIAMATAMVATTVAPAFAADKKTDYTVSKDNAGKLTTELENLLKVKYSVGEEEYDQSGNRVNVANKSVYDVVYKKTGSNIVIDDDVNKSGLNTLKQDIAALSGSQKLTLTVNDKGHKETAGKIIRTQEAKYTNDELAVLNDKFQTEANRPKGVESSKKDGNTVALTLKNNKTLTLEVDKEELDFTKPLDEKGNVVTPKDKDNWTEAELKSIEKFEVKAKENIPSTTYTITVTDSGQATVDVDDLYDGLMLTQKGEELAAQIKDLLNDTGAGKDTSKAEVEENVTIAGNKYQFNITLTDTKGKITTITIEGKDKANVEELNAALQISGKDIVGTKVSKVAGQDRYTTAIEVAKQLNPNGKNIVLVNSTAIVDGLAAGPLAKATNAPILLTTKNNIEAKTIEYIKEIYKESSVKQSERTIYLVGGQSVISEAAEKELKDKFDVKIKRLAGNDRHETSLEVAKAMSKLGNDNGKAYVVGARGEADAMSISPVAAGGGKDGVVNPIIVTGFTSMSKSAMEFLKGKEIDIIGSEGAVSKSIENSFIEKDTNGETVDKDGVVTRIAGTDRHDTNAKVIKEYYNTFNSIYVAKDSYNGRNNEELVDALAAGPLAAENKAPIVIADYKYSSAQDDVLSAKATTTDSKLVQVGNGVASKVITKVAAKLGLIR